MALASVNVSSGGRTPPVTPVIVNVPTQSGTLTYSGSAKTPTWNGYDATQLLIGGTTSATDAGTYTATFTPQGNVTWSDGTSSPKSVTWTIAKATPVLTLSKTSGQVKKDETVTFTATSPSDGTLSVTSSNSNVATATVSGTTITVTGRGSGDATITVSQAATTNYAAKTATYYVAVAKETPTLNLSASSDTIEVGKTLTIAANHTAYAGTISATSSNTSVATVTTSGDNVTVTGVRAGNVTITVSLSGSDVYEAVSKTYTVTIAAVPIITDSWSTISSRAKGGTAGNYYKVGDCKEVVLNGKIGDYLELNNEKLYVYILHINYPMNGVADNNIIWGGFKLADGTDVALCDSKYGELENNNTICFKMNSRYTIGGGWKGCDFRYDILGATSQAPSQYKQMKSASTVGYNATAATLTNPKANTLLAALPTDFRNNLRLWSRWIDAKGDGSNVEANIEETIDAVTLLTEWEVQGARTKANDYEKNHQTQMDYYKNGNSKRKLRHDSTSSEIQWWCSSPYCNEGSYHFCFVYPNGSSDICIASYDEGVAPAFKV